MYNLFLDDERDPYKVTWVDLPLGPWEIVRSYGEFLNRIRNKGIPKFVSFDHDLADEHYLPETDPKTYKEKTGADCARWLVELCLETHVNIPSYQVHSKNPVGADNIHSLMRSGLRIQNDYSRFTFTSAHDPGNQPGHEI